MKETLTIDGLELEKIFDNHHDNYICIIQDYKYIGVDHDLWEFQAIVQRKSDNKYFSVNWFDNYACNWQELGLDEKDYELTEVEQKEKLMTVYE